MLAEPGGVGSLLAGAVERLGGTAAVPAAPAEPGGEGPVPDRPGVPLRGALPDAAWPAAKPWAAATLLCRRWSLWALALLGVGVLALSADAAVRRAPLVSVGPRVSLVLLRLGGAAAGSSWAAGWPESMAGMHVSPAHARMSVLPTHACQSCPLLGASDCCMHVLHVPSNGRAVHLLHQQRSHHVQCKAALPGSWCCLPASCCLSKASLSSSLSMESRSMSCCRELVRPAAAAAVAPPRVPLPPALPPTATGAAAGAGAMPAAARPLCNM
jgi:hypothetical protein